MATAFLQTAPRGATELGSPIVATPLIAPVTDMRTAVIRIVLPCITTVVASMIRGEPPKEVGPGRAGNHQLVTRSGPERDAEAAKSGNNACVEVRQRALRQRAVSALRRVDHLSIS